MLQHFVNVLKLHMDVSWLLKTDMKLLIWAQVRRMNAKLDIGYWAAKPEVALEAGSGQGLRQRARVSV